MRRSSGRGWLRGCGAGVALAWALSGCGTILQPSKSHGAALYGGVRWDVSFLRAQYLDGKGESGAKAARRMVLVHALLLFDLPLCLVADTVLLPYTAVNEVLHWLRDDPVPVETPRSLYPPGPF